MSPAHPTRWQPRRRELAVCSRATTSSTRWRSSRSCRSRSGVPTVPGCTPSTGPVCRTRPPAASPWRSRSQGQALLRRPDVVIAVAALPRATFRAVRQRPDDARALRRRPPAMPSYRAAPRRALGPRRRRRARRPQGPAAGGRGARRARARAVTTHALIWVGDGPLRADVAALAATPRCRRQGGAARVESPQTAVRRCSTRPTSSCCPPRRENFGVAIAEALVHGRPVVVGAPGGQGDFVQRTRRRARCVSSTGVAYADAVERVGRR